MGHAHKVIRLCIIILVCSSYLPIDSGFIDLDLFIFISEFSWYITKERASCAIN